MERVFGVTVSTFGDFLIYDGVEFSSVQGNCCTIWGGLYTGYSRVAYDKTFPKTCWDCGEAWEQARSLQRLLPGLGFIWSPWLALSQHEGIGWRHVC